MLTGFAACTEIWWQNRPVGVLGVNAGQNKEVLNRWFRTQAGVHRIHRKNMTTQSVSEIFFSRHVTFWMLLEKQGGKESPASRNYAGPT
jgi:hypothetical protein